MIDNIIIDMYTYNTSEQEVIGQELELGGLGMIFEAMDLHALFVVYIHVALLGHGEHCFVMQ
jgi:hypothetical protein